MPQHLLDLSDRTRRGEVLDERQFDIKRLPAALAHLIERYQIRRAPHEAVPRDVAMARRVLEAAVELLADPGMYCKDTGRLVTVGKTEVFAALAAAPQEHAIGSGTETVACRCRGLQDTFPPRIFGGANGIPLSERYFRPILASHAAEKVDGIHTGSLCSVQGRPVTAGDPLEILACQQEARWAKAAVTDAGRAGLPILGIMSGVNSQSQTAGDCPGGLTTRDLHLVAFGNDLKLGWEDLRKLIHHHGAGNQVYACCIPLLGGYSGGPEGTAVTSVAEVLQGYLTARPAGFLTATNNLAYGFSERSALWVNGMTALALQTLDHPLYLGTYICGAAGPGTSMLCREIAAGAVTATAAGTSLLLGGIGTSALRPDASSGMEARILGAVARAAAGIDLETADSLVGRLVDDYTPRIAARDVPQGSLFVECTAGGQPSASYQDLWQNERAYLAGLGLTVPP